MTYNFVHMVITAHGLEEDAKLILESLPVASLERSAAPLLVMTVGLPGSGKSTFSRRLAKEIDAVVLESDAARRLLIPKPVHSAGEDRRLWQAIHRAVQEMLRGGVSLILDATNLIEAHRRSIYQIAERVGVRLVIVEVTAAEPVIAERLTEREQDERKLGGTTRWYDLYRSMEARRQAIARDRVTLDTSESSVYERGFWSVVEACRGERVSERMGIRS